MLLKKRDGKLSQSEEQSSADKPCIPLNQMTILVHLECGEYKVPMKVKTNNFDQFYDKVASRFNSKVPGFKSHSMEFQCDKKWYQFNQSTGFDALCLDEDDPEITIKATVMTSESKHLG